MSFSRIAGHDRVIAVLKRVAVGARTPHALLFVGEEGIGKALLVGEFIKAHFCALQPGDGCDRCPTCLKIEHGNHADVTWYRVPEGKRDFPIELIREGLLAELQTKPLELPRRVLVIDEAERFNASSANAFLKVLEDPPGSALLVLISRAASEVIETIRSRCQIVRVAPLDEDAMDGVLTRFEIPDDARGFVKRHARGRPGAALRLWQDGVFEHARVLFDAIFKPERQNPYLLAATVMAWVKGEGERTLIEQRRRLTPLLLVLLSWYRLALDACHDAPLPGDRRGDSGDADLETTVLFAHARRLGALKCEHDLDAVLEALGRVRGNVHPPLVLEHLFQRLWTSMERLGA